MSTKPLTGESIYTSPVTLTVQTTPVGQPRPRASTRGGYLRVHEQTQIHNKRTGERREHPIVMFKAMLKLKWQTDVGKFYGKQPLMVAILCVFPRPSSKTKKRGENPQLPHTSKPDSDNIGKAVCDSLNGIAWHDDSQVCDLLVRKRIAAEGEQPHVVVTVGVAELTPAPSAAG